VIVFVAWPTANVFRSNQNAARWKAAGYKVAVATDLPKVSLRGIDASVPPLLVNKWEGYYRCMNAMAQMLVGTFRADVVVCAGDGIAPDVRFKGHDLASAFAVKFSNGFGVMQPVGDRWEVTSRVVSGTQGAAANRMHATRPSDRRCESPWLGRTFITEANGGAGPFNPEYDQYFGDHELFDTAETAGRLWLNPNIAQPSQHWARGDRDPAPYQLKNFERAYEKDWAKYAARRGQGFPAYAPGTSNLVLP
jgi:hypothetical protein